MDFCFTIPLAIWVIVGIAVSSDVHPWISWAYIHSKYSHVIRIPRVLVERDRAEVYALETTRWGPVLCAFVFFGFFGFSGEAKENYRLLASTLAKIFGFAKFTKNAATPTNFSIHFASRVADAQQTQSTGDSNSFPDRRMAFTGNNEFDPEVPRVPEPVSTPR